MIRKLTVNIGGQEMAVDKIDLKKLVKEQARDLKEIELLEKKISEAGGNVSMYDIAMQDIKLKPDLGYQEGSKEYMKALRLEIKKYQKKIELLDMKMSS